MQQCKTTESSNDGLSRSSSDSLSTTMRIFAASLATETNTFSPLPTGRPAFEAGMYFPAGQHPPSPTFFAGPLWAARERAQTHGWKVIEGLVAAAYPAGVTTRDAYESLRDQILAEVRAALPVDMVVLGLHGAMVADGYDDCEGDLLQRVREIVGPEIAVGATLDPHGHLTEAMVSAADLLICWKEYPHTDIVERAFELVDILAAKVQGRCRPVPVLVDCEMIVPIFTTQEPGRTLVTRQRALEQLPGVLSVSLNHGFPWADVPGMGTKTLVYADDDAPLAHRIARTLADEVIAVRDALRIDEPGIDLALDRALASPTTPVVIADGADNAGGGAASDSTFFLRRLIERGISDAALAPMWDPAVVDMAFNAGLDARLRVRLGGKTGPMSGDPLDVGVTVRAIARGHTMASLTEGERIDCGDSAWLDVDGIDVVVTSRRVQAMGTDLFTGLGCTLNDKRIIVVKSTQHFYAHFSKVAGRVIYASAPGTATSDWDALALRRIKRPKWPLRDLPSAPPATPPLPRQDPGTDWVTDQIERLALRCGAVIGVCAQEVGGPWRVEYQAQRHFFLASTFKVALAATILQAVDRDELSHEDMIEVPRACHVAGSGVITPTFVHKGLSLSVVNLLEVMISESDNTATDVLMARIGGPQRVQRWLVEAGMQGMRMDRNCDRMLRDVYALGDEGTPLEAAARMLSMPGFNPESAFDFSARLEADDRDTATPAGMADLLSRLATGQLLSAASTTLLEGMMLRVRGPRSQRLLARLPAGTPVAHKPGSGAGVINDAGWITLPDGRRFVAAVFSRHGLTPCVQREQAVEEIGRLLYSAFAEVAR